MKYFLKTIFILTISFASFQAQAQATKPVTVKGPQSCGEWVEGKMSIYGRSWLLGYLSGLSSGYRVDALKDTESKSLFLWMENYCKANPLSHIDDGGRELFRELIKRNNIDLSK